ncbi:MAG: peroxidase [Luteitalea sp.]|nr:peroxidase [Luteitalea sp.]
MAFITITPPEQSEGDLADVYRRVAASRGGVAAVHQVQSLNPRVLSAHLDLYHAIMFQPSPLSRAQREAIGVAVSRANGCAYCVAHHGETYARLGSPPVEPRLLLWAKRLAREPERASAADIDELRTLGLEDRAILDAIQTVAYFSYVNHLVLATGLHLEEDFEATCRPELDE